MKVVKYEEQKLFKIITAETENLIKQYYVSNNFCSEAIDLESASSFYVGRTGLGKTAILKHVELYSEDKPNVLVIKVRPEEFAFQIMERSEVLKVYSILGINFRLFYKTLWQSIILAEIFKKIYGNDRKGKIAKFLTFGVENKAYKLLESLDDLDGDRTFSEKVSNLISKMEHHCRSYDETNQINNIPAGPHTTATSWALVKNTSFLSLRASDRVGTC
jgi:hypothetical protein